MIPIKTPEDLKRMRVACRLSAELFREHPHQVQSQALFASRSPVRGKARAVVLHNHEACRSVLLEGYTDRPATGILASVFE